MKLQGIQELEAIICEDYGNMAGIIVQQEGTLIYEKYFNEGNESCRCHVFSVTKSVLSILIGIAIDQGYIRDVRCKILDFFPEYVTKRGEKTIQSITLEHMLTMTAPYKYKSAPYTKFFTSEDWVKASLGIETPSNITFASKEDQMAYYNTNYTNGWVADPRGVNTGAWGLSLSTRDMVKLGQLYLNHGMWNGRQIVSAEWIRESTTEHSRWKQMNLPYGYLWWILQDGSGFAAMGDGGNTIYVDSEHRLVVAITSLFQPRVKDRIEFIQKGIVPRIV